MSGRRRSMRFVVLTTALLVTSAVSAGAQVYIGRGGDAPRRGSWEAGGGIVWTAGFDLPTTDALLTGNDGNAGSPFTLFTAEARVQPVFGAQGRVGFYMSRSLAFEAGIQYSRPVLRAEIGDDAEDAPDLTVEEQLSRYIIDGSLVLHLPSLQFSQGRGMPFVQAGAGYLRELHEGEELVETGTTYHAGAGVKYWVRQGKRRIGLRGDVGVSVRDGGFDFEDTRRVLPTAGASLILLF